MKHIKIAAGLAHVNYGNIAGIVKEISDEIGRAHV